MQKLEVRTLQTKKLQKFSVILELTFYCRNGIILERRNKKILVVIDPGMSSSDARFLPKINLPKNSSRTSVELMQ